MQEPGPEVVVVREPPQEALGGSVVRRAARARVVVYRHEQGRESRTRPVPGPWVPNDDGVPRGTVPRSGRVRSILCGVRR